MRQRTVRWEGGWLASGMVAAVRKTRVNSRVHRSTERAGRGHRVRGVRAHARRRFPLREQLFERRFQGCKAGLAVRSGRVELANCPRLPSTLPRALIATPALGTRSTGFCSPFVSPVFCWVPEATSRRNNPAGFRFWTLARSRPGRRMAADTVANVRRQSLGARKGLIANPQDGACAPGACRIGPLCVLAR